jgi:hypothetical protein
MYRERLAPLIEAEGTACWDARAEPQQLRLPFVEFEDDDIPF